MWQTTSLVLRAGGEVVLVDPGITPDEVAAVRAAAEEDGGRVVAVLVTHTDWDHVIGVGAFPEALACMAPRAAALVGDGSAERGLTAAAGELAAWGPPRVDRVLEPHVTEAVGPFEVVALELPGHTACCTAFEVPQLDLLVVGDYLSPAEFPTMEHSPALYRRSLETLVAIIGSRPGLTVVPGHGAPMPAEVALRVGRDDLAYLRAVHAAAAEALAGGRDASDAAGAAAAVEPPRPALLDAVASRRRTAELEVAEILAGGPMPTK